MGVRFRRNANAGRQVNEEILLLFEETLGPKIVSAAQRTVPVDTHNLQESIEFSSGIEGDVVRMIVGTDVEYGLYVEEGTSRMAAQPWLRPAVLQGGGSQMVSYTTKAGNTRKATQAQVDNWTRGSR